MNRTEFYAAVRPIFGGGRYRSRTDYGMRLERMT